MSFHIAIAENFIYNSDKSVLCFDSVISALIPCDHERGKRKIARAITNHNDKNGMIYSRVFRVSQEYGFDHVSYERKVYSVQNQQTQ